MWKASLAYLTGFTFLNILSFLYLNAAVLRYKKGNILPKWAQRSRLFLDNLDDTIQPYEVEEINSALKEIDKVFDFFNLKDFSPMPFLQIRFDQNAKYDFRDDYEFGQATKNLSQPADSERKNEEIKQPLNNINEELFEAAKSDPDVRVDLAKTFKGSKSDKIAEELGSISK